MEKPEPSDLNIFRYQAEESLNCDLDVRLQKLSNGSDKRPDKLRGRFTAIKYEYNEFDSFNLIAKLGRSVLQIGNISVKPDNTTDEFIKYGAALGLNIIDKAVDSHRKNDDPNDPMAEEIDQFRRKWDLQFTERLGDIYLPITENSHRPHSREAVNAKRRLEATYMRGTIIKTPFSESLKNLIGHNVTGSITTNKNQEMAFNNSYHMTLGLGSDVIADQLACIESIRRNYRNIKAAPETREPQINLRAFDEE